MFFVFLKEKNIKVKQNHIFNHVFNRCGLRKYNETNSQKKKKKKKNSSKQFKFQPNHE